MAKIQFVSGKAQHQSNCICVYNIDISSGGCPIALDPKTGQFNKNNECTYCYAGYVHKNYVKSKDIDEKVWKNFKPTALLNVIRVGKNLEPGHPRFRKDLIKVLELNNKYGFKTILITKLLELDNSIVTLLKEKDSTVHFSMGNEHMEKGAVLNGSTNEWRLSTAREYHKRGVNTYIRIVEDVAMPMRKEVKYWCSSGIPVLITPLRYNSKKVLSQYNASADWDELKQSEKYQYINGYLQATKWHEDYKPYRERCGKLAGIEYCNNCGLKNVKHFNEVKI